MPNYAAPTKDIEFILFDVVNIPASPIPSYCYLNPALVSALVYEVKKYQQIFYYPSMPLAIQKAAGLTLVPYARQAGLSLRSKQYGTVAGVG